MADPNKEQQVADAGKAPRAVIVVDNPQLQRIYSNFVALQTSNLDAKVAFGIVRESAEKEVSVMQLVEVYMTHVQLRALYELLARNIDLSKPHDPETASPIAAIEPR